MVRGAHGTDFAPRLDALQSRLERPDAVIEAVRGANTSLDPQQVAAWLVWQAGEWIPAPCWAVVVPDVDGRLTVLAEKGWTPELHPTAWAVVARVVARGEEFMSGDMAKDQPGGAVSGSTVGLPLTCRNRTLAVLVGLDPIPSAAAPSLGAPVLAAIRTLFEPIAIALDNALSFQEAEALSVTDDLTGLSNSRYLNLVLRREEKRAVRSGRQLSVLFIDMDGFKDVNTHHGHLAGSQALVEAGAIHHPRLRSRDGRCGEVR